MSETEEVDLSDQPELTPVREVHRFDEQRLAEDLQDAPTSTESSFR